MLMFGFQSGSYCKLRCGTGWARQYYEKFKRPTSGNASFSGSSNTIENTQTGNNNNPGYWTYGDSPTTKLTQTGNSNIGKVDNPDPTQFIITTVTGDSNTTHDEIGNGNDTGNSIETIIVGDSNNSYVEVLDGDNNDIEVQVQNEQQFSKSICRW